MTIVLKERKKKLKPQNSFGRLNCVNALYLKLKQIPIENRNEQHWDN